MLKKLILCPKFNSWDVLMQYTEGCSQHARCMCSGPTKTCTNTRRVSSRPRLWAQPKGRACSPGLSSMQTQSHSIRGPTEVNTAGSGCVCVSMQCNPGKVSVQFPFLAAWPYLKSWACAFSSLAFNSCMWDKDGKSLLWFRLYAVWGRLWMIQKVR